ncbi:NAD(P)-binding protein [Periconia macrospinosa]|uniref:NAD(P)-binding protein n=1 Tax=Periconia macrospinosa TaxID=97972 RepID=A0A2V1DLP6_9PLEO|nr:NAD(P)-binding protein [Periconia macrospinosa]
MAASTPIKIAIVGTGLIGPRHAEAVANQPDAQLSCIVDSNPIAAEAVARKFNCPWFTSVEDMLASQEHRPNAALVCTPNHTHVAVSKSLLEGGIHVLCEKPISVDIETGKELVFDIETSQTQLLIGHHRRFNRYVLAAKPVISSLGKVVAVSGLWTIYKPPEYFEAPTEWRRLSTAGPILINLIHEIDILHYWFGPIVRVFAEQTASQRGHAAEEGAAITLRFSSGIVGTFILADAVVSPHNFESGTGENPMIPGVGRDCYRVFGSEASFSFPDMTRWSYTGQRSWTETISSECTDVPETRVPFELQIEHFVKVVKGEQIPGCTGRDGLRAVMVCEAIKRSMVEQSPIEISLDS